MNSEIKQQTVLLPHEEQSKRIDCIRSLMSKQNISAILICDKANIYYLTGRVFTGYIYIPLTGIPIYFVRRPVELEGDGTIYIHKPELIPNSLDGKYPESIGLEFDTLCYSQAQRLMSIFGADVKYINASSVMRTARSIKTDYELELIKLSGVKQTNVYAHIPRLYKNGMTDLELQVEIERCSRLEGCLGQFRISGDSMELFMGNVLTGENADTPCPYDFAMGEEVSIRQYLWALMKQ